MATNPTGESRVPLVQRVKNILTTPKAEWPVIDSEPGSIGGIYKNYVVILAAIPPVCLLIGMLAFGGRFVSMNFLIAQAVIGYLVALASVYILALIIEALAPSFGGTKDRVKGSRSRLMQARPPGSSGSSTCFRSWPSWASSARSTASICSISACRC
jgi:hypothetical protein